MQAARSVKTRGHLSGGCAPIVLYNSRDCRRAGRGCGFDACANRREVDPPRKYLPRKKITSDFRSLARGHTELCIKVLPGIVSQEPAPPAARLSAAGTPPDGRLGPAPFAPPRHAPRLPPSTQLQTPHTSH